jgi:hypothetical protein
MALTVTELNEGARARTRRLVNVQESAEPVA